jgi:hypothetical protein
MFVGVEACIETRDRDWVFEHRFRVSRGRVYSTCIDTSFNNDEH